LQCHQGKLASWPNNRFAVLEQLLSHEGFGQFFYIYWAHGLNWFGNPIMTMLSLQLSWQTIIFGGKIVSSCCLTSLQIVVQSIAVGGKT
jgi:hypothetical protein